MENESSFFQFSLSPPLAELALRGEWTLLNVTSIEGSLQHLGLQALPVQSIVFRCGGLQGFDLSGAWVLYRTAQDLRGRGVEMTFSGFREEHMKFIEHVLQIKDSDESPTVKSSSLRRFGVWYTRLLLSMGRELRDRYFWFQSVYTGLALTILSPRRLRWIATARHIQDVGINAVGIVTLMAFLVAVVLGFQSQIQLSQFGAQIFTVDLVSISMLREMGGLLTAILVAGRSGSAFAAEIGVMQLNEEVAAMETMGISPFDALVLPRIIALLICLPLLTFIADIAGLIGMAFIVNGLMDIPISLVVERFLALNPLVHFQIGILKAPFFALVIGIIGTYRGYYVERSAGAVGRNTTSAVVESIFMVIAVDAIFSLFFTEITW